MKNSVFIDSHWIWNSFKYGKDEYVVFKSHFISKKNKVLCRISCNSDYMIYINDKFVAFEQYQSYPEYPIYDELYLDVVNGKNEIKILAYYCGGDDFSTYYKDLPGLIFEIVEDDNVLLASDESIISGLSVVNESHHEEKITLQLSYRPFLDLTKNENDVQLSKSVLINKSRNFNRRPNQKTEIVDNINPKIKKIDDLHYLFDFGKEIAGYIDFDIFSSKEQNAQLYWGEHIIDGGVRRFTDRHFSFDIRFKKGVNQYFSTFNRLGLRYLELILEAPININHLNIKKVAYPFKYKKIPQLNDLRTNIYLTARNTLECCYHEHFEDCPWREQALYSMDARNQILFHTKAFKNMETIKSSIELMLKDSRKDKFLSLTFPSSNNLVITSYGLFVVESVYRYLKFSKDIESVKKWYPRILEIIDQYRSLKGETGLLDNLNGKNYWNFYEWVDGLDALPIGSYNGNDSMLSLLYVYALKYLSKIEKALLIKSDISNEINKLKKLIKKEYLNKENGLMMFSKNNQKIYESVNSVAVLCGILNKSQKKTFAEAVMSKSLVSSSLSYKCFTYDALLSIDKRKYKNYILSDLDSIFEKQLKQGATTFWETEKGANDFDGAGSLCHAWSALPVYYYSILK